MPLFLKGSIDQEYVSFFYLHVYNDLSVAEYIHMISNNIFEMIFLKTQTLVKCHWTKLTNVQYFTFSFVYSAHFMPYGCIFLFVFASCNNFFSNLCLLKSADNLPGGSLLGLLGVGWWSASCLLHKYCLLSSFFWSKIVLFHEELSYI